MKYVIFINLLLLVNGSVCLGQHDHTNLGYLRSKLHTIIDPRLIRTYMSTSSDASSTSSNKSNLEFLEITRAHGQKATLEPNSTGSRRSMLLRSKKDNVEAAKRKLKNMLLRTRKRNNSNFEDQRKQNLKKIIWASLGLRNWKAYPPPPIYVLIYIFLSMYYVQKKRQSSLKFWVTNFHLLPLFRKGSSINDVGPFLGFYDSLPLSRLFTK